jgi:N-acetylglucosamine transport system permease protein
MNPNTLPADLPQSSQSTQRTRSLERLRATLPAYVVLGLWTLFIVYAIGWIVLASLSTTREIFSNALLSSGLHFENYGKAFGTLNMARYFLNTLIYVSISLALITAVAAPAAYVLSRFEFRGRRFITQLFVAGMGIPSALLVIPLYMLFIRLNLVDNPVGLILVYVGTSIPFTVFFLTGFFASLPKELEEAAFIDGCTDRQVFFRIMLPLARPGIATVTIFNFLGLWNEYFWALVMVNTPEQRTLSLGLQALLQGMRFSGDWAGLFASIVIVVLPTIVFFLFQARQIMGGVTAGAVKGFTNMSSFTTSPRYTKSRVWAV